AKSSSDLPDLIAADSQRGFKPRPAHVSEGFSGLRYFGATARPADDFFPRWYPPSLESSASRARRCSVTLRASVASISLLSFISLSIDIDFSATASLLNELRTALRQRGYLSALSTN